MNHDCDRLSGYLVPRFSAAPFTTTHTIPFTKTQGRTSDHGSIALIRRNSIDTYEVGPIASDAFRERET